MVFYQFLIILSLVAVFKVQYILVEVLNLLLWVHSYVLEFIKMSMKAMD